MADELRAPVGEFLYRFFALKYGLRNVAEMYLVNFVTSLKKYWKADPEKEGLSRKSYVSQRRDAITSPIDMNFLETIVVTIVVVIATYFTKTGLFATDTTTANGPNAASNNTTKPTSVNGTVVCNTRGMYLDNNKCRVCPQPNKTFSVFWQSHTDGCLDFIKTKAFQYITHVYWGFALINNQTGAVSQTFQGNDVTLLECANAMKQFGFDGIDIDDESGNLMTGGDWKANAGSHVESYLLAIRKSLDAVERKPNERAYGLTWDEFPTSLDVSCNNPKGDFQQYDVLLKSTIPSVWAAAVPPSKIVLGGCVGKPGDEGACAFGASPTIPQLQQYASDGYTKYGGTMLWTGSADYELNRGTTIETMGKPSGLPRPGSGLSLCFELLDHHYQSTTLMEKPSQAAGTALQPSPSKPGTTTCTKVLTLMQHMAPMLVFNAVMPLAIYKLAKPHTTKIMAVFLSGLIPMFKALVTFFWFRKQDAISMIQLFGVLVSVIIDHHGSEEAARIQRRVGSDRGHVYDRVAVVARRRHVQNMMFYQIRRTLSDKTTQELDAHYQKPVVRQDRSLQLKTHHEWYFLLWRCTFPLLTLLLVVGVSALGRLGGVVGYALSAGPVWFYCMLIVLATPFLLMFRFPNFHPGMVTTFWKVLFLCSAFISVIEVFVWTGGKSQYAHHHHHHGSSMMGQRKLSWLLGNLLFGIVGFIGVPFFFSLQPRVRIDSSEVQDDAAAALVSLPTSPSGFNPHAGMAGKMARPSAAALGLVLLITVCAYFPIKKPAAPARANAVDVYWGLAYLLSPMFLVWLVVHTRETIHVRTVRCCPRL
ncbi:hypothetical protein DYB35_006614 [Aphanomyces astaci]|uniref:GH18 domain-containing protein n=1 Tax=Aphanomyces astaci TaxID=112090 RepID=A0A3R6ZK98_APHAT|nr:hypothetical protein DYB35_006614 [Aphanomyces astaci]